MSSPSDTILSITTKYLGPAAGVFLQRQAKAHIQGTAFADLRPSDLPVFLYWVGVSSSLLIGTKSEALVAELSKALNVQPATSRR